MTIKIDDIIEQLDFFDPDICSYYDRKQCTIISINTGDVEYVSFTDSDLPDWEKQNYKIYQEIQNDIQQKRFVPLPDEFDLHEEKIIQDYCLQLTNHEQTNRLLCAFNGHKAFRKFKNQLYREKLEADYYQYKYQQMKAIAINWCKENKIKFVD